MEPVIIVGLRRQGQTQSQFTYQMTELRRLVETADGVVEAEVTQSKPHPDPATLIGSGKVKELGEEAEKRRIKTIIFDDDLTAAQQKNIEKLIPAKIIDRTRLILDIFAKRARSKEGQLQVELAQLNYLVPRLTGSWRGFSQQVGGIGTRGPGERKIEVERRYVRERIKHLKKDIGDIRNHRDRARLSREGVPLPQVALIGYTNVGKSTLLNTLVGKEDTVYADDKLFATLDPTTRRVKLPGGQRVLFTDTVGFIQKMPPFLKEAFQATLEEVTRANLLVHVVDSAAENWKEQQNNVMRTLKTLEADHVPIMTVYNKVDCLNENQNRLLSHDGTLLISSRKKIGLEFFLEAIEAKLDEALIEVSFKLPYDHQNLVSDIYKTGHILSEEPQEGGTLLKVRIDKGNWQKISHRLNLNGVNQ